MRSGALLPPVRPWLRLTTTRLWSWRDEDGSEAECFAELGQAALGAATKADGLWPWLSGRP